MNGGGNRAAMFLLGATLALGFVAASRHLSTALVRMRQEDVIRVKGTAEARIRSDLATWRGELTVRTGSLSDAYARIEAQHAAVAAFVGGYGFASKAVTWLPVTVETENKLDEKGNRLNQVENYVLRETVQVKAPAVDRVAALSLAASGLLREGLEFRSFPPEYVYTGIETIKMDLLAQATRNAYARANTLAGNSNGRVGLLTSASQGVFQITAPDSTDVNDYGTYDTTTIEKTVKAVVTLAFRIEKVP